MVVDLLDPHPLTRKHVTEVDFASFETEAPAVGHRDREIVEGILEVKGDEAIELAAVAVLTCAFAPYACAQSRARPEG